MHELDEVPGRILDHDRSHRPAADQHGSPAGRDDRRAELFQSRERRIDIAHADHQHHGARVLNRSLDRPTVSARKLDNLDAARRRRRAPDLLAKTRVR